MMSRHFGLISELSGAIAKKQPSAPGSFFNQFVTDIYIYTHTQINRVLIVRIYSRLRLIGSLFNWVSRLIGPLLVGPENTHRS